MASGQHFIQGVPLVGIPSLTTSDIDTSTVGLRLGTNRYMLFYKSTAPNNTDSPDWQYLAWVRPTDNNRRTIALYNGFTFQNIVADVDLSAADPATLPVNAIYPGSLGQIISVVATVDGPRCQFIDIPDPYVVGANGTAVMSNGFTGAFRYIEGADIRSNAAGTNVWPLISDGALGSVYAQLPPAAIETPTGLFKTLVSRSGGDYASAAVNLVDTQSYTDVAMVTPATAGYVPKADGAGAITWVDPVTLESPYYETQAASRISFASLTAIAAGDYNTATIDTITYTTQKPYLLQVWAECTSGEFGYLAGDRVELSALTDSTGDKNADFRVTTSGLSAIVKVVVYGLFLSNVTSPSGTIVLSALTPASWRFVVTAHKI